MEGEAAAVPIVSVSTSDETNNPNTGMSQEECKDRIRESLRHPTVRFLREQMEKAGCPVWVRLLLATKCSDQGSAGGYASKRGVPEVYTLLPRGSNPRGKITICCNHMTFQDEINQVLIHELIHAYDDCRAKNMDWKNCGHHACSEIRANHLSGDCHYKRELLRGFMKIRGHEQAMSFQDPTWCCFPFSRPLPDSSLSVHMVYHQTRYAGIQTGSRCCGMCEKARSEVCPKKSTLLRCSCKRCHCGCLGYLLQRYKSI
ncbi:putative Mitochondrial inner membrane protease ATP23 [Cocos nucifera]|nr:putative Mitochondrial inner membrane protease ATP23 [Cocos nucifera]